MYNANEAFPQVYKMTNVNFVSRVHEILTIAKFKQRSVKQCHQSKLNLEFSSYAVHVYVY